MKKRKKQTSAHLENLINLRESNPQAYARLGDEADQGVKSYEAGLLAADFEYRPGTERLIELRERLPRVYATFSHETRKMVEEYLRRKLAHQLVADPTGIRQSSLEVKEG
jgi:uncharacterized protein YicC (UPF0701 family)